MGFKDLVLPHCSSTLCFTHDEGDGRGVEGGWCEQSHEQEQNYLVTFHYCFYRKRVRQAAPFKAVRSHKA